MENNFESNNQSEQLREKWKDYTVGVFCASSDKDRTAIENARELGGMLAVGGYDARNGGYNVGAMGALAEAFAAKGREFGLAETEIAEHLSGVVLSEKAVGPSFQKERGTIAPAKIESGDTLAERAGKLIQESDALVVLEGGMGTLLEGFLAAQGEWLQNVNPERADSPKPIIIIDSRQLLPDMVEFVEKRAKGAIKTIPDSVYVLSGHSNPGKVEAGSLEEATLANDSKMREQLNALLELSYLRVKDSANTEDNTKRIMELESGLFGKNSPSRVQSLKEQFDAKQEFSEGAGI